MDSNSQTRKRGRPPTKKTKEQVSKDWSSYLKEYRRKLKEAETAEQIVFLQFSLFPRERSFEESFSKLLAVFTNVSNFREDGTALGMTKAEFIECAIDSKRGRSAQRVVDRFGLGLCEMRDLRKMLDGQIDHFEKVEKHATAKQYKAIGGNADTFRTNINVFIEFSNQLQDLIVKKTIEVNKGNKETLVGCTHPKHCDTGEPIPLWGESGVQVPPSYCGKHLGCYMCREIEEPIENVCCTECGGGFKISDIMATGRLMRVTSDAKPLMRDYLSPCDKWFAENPALQTALLVHVNL